MKAINRSNFKKYDLILVFITIIVFISYFSFEYHERGLKQKLNLYGTASATEATTDIADYETNKSLVMRSNTDSPIIKQIKVSGYPNDISVNPKTNRIYYTVSSSGNVDIPMTNDFTNESATNYVNIIDVNTDYAVKRIFLGSTARNIAINALTNMIYVTTNSGLSIINGENDRLIGRVAIVGGGSLVETSPQSSMTYVFDAQFENLFVVNGTGNITKQAPISIIEQDIAINPDTKLMYAYKDFNKIVAINLTDLREVKEILLRQPGEGIASNPQNNLIYVINSQADRVFVIDGIRNNIVNTIVANVTQSAGGSTIEINPSTNLAFVGNSYLRYISVIDLNTNLLIKTIPIEPLATKDLTLNPATNTLYTFSINGVISAIDVSKDAISKVSSIPRYSGINIQGRINGIAVNPNTERLYIINEELKGIDVFDSTTDQLLTTILLSNYPSAVDVNTLTNNIYAVIASDVVVIDGSTNNITDYIKDVAAGSSDIAIDSRTNTIYILKSANVTIIDGYSKKATSADLPNAGSFAINPDTGAIYVTNSTYVLMYDQSSNTTSVVFNASNNEDLRYTLDLAINPITGLLYVGGVDVIDISTQTVIDHIETGDYTDDIAVNSKTNTIYVINSLSDTLYVIDGMTNNIKHSIPVGRAPEYLTIDEKNNMIYVGNGISETLSIIDGRSNGLTFVVQFNTQPLAAGSIDCNGEKTGNYTRFNVGTLVECTAKPSTGFTFSSWSGDILYTPSNISAMSFIASKYGILTANFVIPVTTNLSIPPEFWAPFYALIPGFFVPSIVSWLGGYRQRRNLKQYTYDLGKLDKATMEKKIEDGYMNGKIAEPHYELLKRKISEYYSS